MKESPYRSILTALYWAGTTITTAGYGDLAPTSGVGRFPAVILMHCGLIVVACPVGVIGTCFTDEYKQAIEKEKILKNKTKLSTLR